MRFCGKLYVRIRSDRSTVRICAFRASAAASAACSCASWASFARSIRIARSLFCSCERSFWQDTTIPDGRWVIRTAESVVFTLCPPGPLDRNTSTRRSPGSIVTSVSSASGVTSTPAAEVWMRPCDSVAGTRCTRCTPPSHFSRDQTPYPPSGTPRVLTATATSLYPPRSDSCASSTSVTQPRLSAYRRYMRSRSPANSADSSPPSPALISRMTSLPSSGSRGASNSASFSSMAGSRSASTAVPAANAGSSAASSRAATRPSRACASSAAALAIGVSSAKRRPTRRATAWSAWIAGSASRASSSAYSSSSVLSRSSLIPFSLRERHPPPAGPGRVPSRALLGLLRLGLGVLLLELRDPAGGVEHALLAGVERVAGVTGLYVDLAVLRRAAGGEAVAARTRDSGHDVLRVDFRLHADAFLSSRSPGRHGGREPVPGLHNRVCHAQWKHPGSGRHSPARPAGWYVQTV